MASAPAAPAPAPAAPADAGTNAAPKSLNQVILEQKAVRGKSVQGPPGGFVKMGGKPAPVAPALTPPSATTAAKAGAPVATKPTQPEVAAPVKTESSPAAPAPDAQGELKKAFDAKSRELAELRKQFTQYEELAKGDFKSLVMKLAEHYKADPQKVAEQLLMERANQWAEEQELAKLSPEEREYRELKRDAEQRKAAEAKAAEKAKADAIEAQGRQTYEATTSKLIEAHKLLPESVRSNPEFNGRAALRVKDRLLAMALATDPATPADEWLATIDPKQLAAEAWADHQAELKQALLAMSDEELDAYLDPKLTERWTRKLQGAARARAHPSLTAQPRTAAGKFAPGSATPAPEPKPLSAMKPAWGSFLPKSRK